MNKKLYFMVCKDELKKMLKEQIDYCERFECKIVNNDKEHLTIALKL